MAIYLHYIWGYECTMYIFRIINDLNISEHFLKSAWLKYSKYSKYECDVQTCKTIVTMGTVQGETKLISIKLPTGKKTM